MSARGGTEAGGCLLTSHLGDALQTRDGQGHHDAQAGANHQQAMADEQTGHRQALVPWTERGKWRGSRQLRGAGGRRSVPHLERPPASSPSARPATHGLPGLSGHTLCSLPLLGKTGTRGWASVPGRQQQEPPGLPGERGPTAPRTHVPAREPHISRGPSAMGGLPQRLPEGRRARPGSAWETVWEMSAGDGRVTGAGTALAACPVWFYGHGPKAHRHRTACHAQGSPEGAAGPWDSPGPR